MGVVGILLRASVVVLLAYGGLLYLTYLGLTTTPTGFIPSQDKGYLLVNVQLPDSTSVERTQEIMRNVEVAARRVLALHARVARDHGVELPELDLGGGFGIAYTSEHDPLDPQQLAKQLADIVERECRGFGVAVPSGAWPAIVAGVALGAAAFCGLGFALATFVDSVETAQPAIQAVLVPMFFISDIWIPNSSLPGWVNSLASALPVEHVSDVLHRAFAAGALAPGPVAVDLAVLAAWALGGALVAILVGPWVGSLCIAIVLAVQALLFADGGLTALGTNIVNMALVGVFVAPHPRRRRRHVIPDRTERIERLRVLLFPPGGRAS